MTSKAVARAGIRAFIEASKELDVLERTVAAPAGEPRYLTAQSIAGRTPIVATGERKLLHCRHRGNRTDDDTSHLFRAPPLSSVDAMKSAKLPVACLLFTSPL